MSKLRLLAIVNLTIASIFPAHETGGTAYSHAKNPGSNNVSCTNAMDIARAAAPAIFAENPELQLLSVSPETPTFIHDGAPLPIDSQSPMWISGWHGERPARDLILAWAKSDIHGLFECQNPTTFEGHRIVSSDEAGRARMTAHVPNVPTFARISAPVIDKTGSSALLYMHSEGPGGREQFFHLRRTSGAWKVVGSRVNTVS